MNLRLQGKRALMAGVSPDIGDGVAKTLAREGASVVLNGPAPDVNRIAQDITADGGRAAVATGDIGTDEGAERVADRALVLYGGVEILIHQPAVFPDHGWLRSTPKEWLDIYDKNVVAFMRLVRFLVPQMRDRGWGRVIQISGAVGAGPHVSVPNFVATQAANVNLTLTLTRELALSGITVNTISPGPVVTQASETVWRDLAERQGWDTDWKSLEQRLCREVLYSPSGRLGRVDDVANLVAFIASPLADFINGANLRVDGGLIAAAKHLSLPEVPI